MSRIDWRHAFLLSLLGLVDAGLAIYTTMSSSYEPFVWLVIYIAWFVLLARKRPAAPVAQALATSLLSAVWVALSQNALFGTYAANHPDVADQAKALSTFQRVAGFTFSAFTFAILLGLFLGFLLRWQLQRTDAV